jgi:cephalosporin-C deacetylase
VLFDELRKAYAFDPTYGYDLSQLMRVPAPGGPVDFASFWQATHELAAAIPLRLSTREIDSKPDGPRIYEVEFNSWGNFRTGGWVTIPREGKVRRGFVISHGYGGREAPDLALPVGEAAAIFPCARGFHRSACAGIPGDGSQHVLIGIESREKYVHRGCAAEIWAALRALLEFVPETGKRLDYIGGSFGGGIGALMLPWESRFRSAYLAVPSFGNHPLRVTLPCTGSGESVRKYYQKRPEVLDVLAYYDSATAARHIRVPVLFSCALFDPAVPPPGQFAVYNGVPGTRKLVVRQAGHCEYPGQVEDDGVLDASVRAWFA